MDELIDTGDSGGGSINDRWTNIKHIILKAVKESLGKETGVARKSQIDKETLELTDERRRYKNSRDEHEKMQYIRDLGTKCREDAERRKITGQKENVEKQNRYSRQEKKR